MYALNIKDDVDWQSLQVECQGIIVTHVVPMVNLTMKAPILMTRTMMK